MSGCVNNTGDHSNTQESIVLTFGTECLTLVTEQFNCKQFRNVSLELYSGST